MAVKFPKMEAYMRAETEMCHCDQKHQVGGVRMMGLSFP